MESKVCVICGAPGLVLPHRWGTGATYQRDLCHQHMKEQGSRNGEKASPHQDGDRVVTPQGYVRVTIRTPEGRRRSVEEHRLVMEQILGRPLRAGESIHHRNGHRDDNRPENLELWAGSHKSGQRAAELRCPHCHKDYLTAREQLLLGLG